MPGAVSLFARAYQRQIGGNLTGSAATKALRKAMADRKVTGSILTVAGDLAAETAAPSLEPAKLASQAEQARYQNTVNDLAVVASNAGVEEGFARIFRTLNAGLSESNGLVESLASGFNDATKFADDLLLFPQSFIRALEGRDSIVADWLGADATKQLQADWQSIRASLDSISSIGAPSWLPTLQTTSQDIAAQFRIIAQIASGDFTGLGDALTNFVTGRYQTYGNAVASGPNLALRAVGNAFDIPVPQINFGNGPDTFAPQSVLSTYGLGNNPSNSDPRRYDLFSREPIGPRESNAFGQDPAGINYNLPTNEFDRSFIGNDPKQVNTTNNDIRIELNIDPVTLGQIDIQTQADQLASTIALRLQETLVFFPEKE